MMRDKIGLGLITCNSLDKFKQSASTVPSFFCSDNFVVVNDGDPYDKSTYPNNAYVIEHDKNYGVSKSKNDAIAYLLSMNCNHIFLMEDDILIKNIMVFDKYIEASKVSGIQHFNYALQGPLNREQEYFTNNYKSILRIKNAINKLSRIIVKRDIFLDKYLNMDSFDLIKSLDENSPPNPRLVYRYNSLTSISLYRNCVGAFSYYSKNLIDEIGLFDENFYNALEHIEHTLRSIDKKLHPPFYWFVDIHNSQDYLSNIDNCIQESTISKMGNRSSNIDLANKYFLSKYGYNLSDIKDSKIKAVIKSLMNIQKNRKPETLSLLIKFPTRNRPEKFFETLDKYISMMENKDNFKIIVSCDLDDTSMNNASIIQRLESYDNLTYFFRKNKNKIEAINSDIDKNINFDILLLASDDMIPQVFGYDTIIRKNLLKYFPDMDGVLWFNDGYRKNDLNTLCIMGKKYYDRFGYIYHPSYISLWCDNEFMVVANKLKRQVYIDQVIIRHEHPDNLNESENYDTLMKLNQSFFSRDQKNFIDRKKKNFDIDKINSIS